MNDFKHIDSFLDKFRNILFKKDEINNLILKVLFDNLNFNFDKNDIKIKNGIIFINTSPLIKNEILIKKRKILDEIKKQIPQNNILDIK